MPEEKSNVISFLDAMHPRIGDVYEFAEDVLVIALEKDYNKAVVKLLDTTNPARSSTRVEISIKKFGAHNHIGNYEEIMNNSNW